MIFFFNANGDLVKSAPQAVYQGSSNAGEVYIVAPFSPAIVVSVAFELADGSYTRPYICANHGEVDMDLPDGFSVWYTSLDGQITQYYGVAKMQALFYVQGAYYAYRGVLTKYEDLPTLTATEAGYIYYVEEEGKSYFWTGAAWEEITTSGTNIESGKAAILASQSVSITINKGVAPIIPSEPTDDVWQDILSAISTYASNQPTIKSFKYNETSIGGVSYDEETGILWNGTQIVKDSDNREYSVNATIKTPIAVGDGLQYNVYSKRAELTISRDFIATTDTITIDGGEL